MGDLRREVRLAVHALLDTLDLFRDADPTALIDDAAHDFNLVLDAANRAFPESMIIKALRPLDGRAALITLVTRLSTLKGAVDAEP
jgi:hypothetical protein